MKSHEKTLPVAAKAYRFKEQINPSQFITRPLGATR